MMDKKKIRNLSEKEWEEAASLLSGEKGKYGDLLNSLAEDMPETVKQWKDLRNMDDESTNVDKAWNNVYSRIREGDPHAGEISGRVRFLRSTFLKVAAAALLIIGFGTLALFMNKSGFYSSKLTFESGENQRNLRVDLPDGSIIYLNRNSELNYRAAFGEKTREVKLKGEAFFEISADAAKPFTIDAGKATVQVVGTSFSVLTENTDTEVEVFVKTGKVVLSDKSGEQSLVLDPGYIGIIDSEKSSKSINNNPNYLAWNSGKLVYKGEKLGVVLSDLRKYYNMNVVADDPSILEFPWHSPIDYESRDIIISLICTSFNLSYLKDGAVYHLVKK